MTLLQRINDARLTPSQLAAGVHDAGPWRGPTTEEWVERIARGSTPVREYVDGKFQPWIERPATRRAGDSDLTGGLGTAERRDVDHRPAGSPVADPSLASAGADLS